MKSRYEQKRLRIVVYILLILWALISIFPVYWMLTFSLKTNAEIFGENVAGLPREWVWSNYTRALHTGDMPRYFLNSLVVALTTIFITLAASVMATYSITRLRWKGRRRMNAFFMLGLTIPIHRAALYDPGQNQASGYALGADHSLFGLLSGHGDPGLHRLYGRYPL